MGARLGDKVLPTPFALSLPALPPAGISLPSPAPRSQTLWPETLPIPLPGAVTQLAPALRGGAFPHPVGLGTS